MGIKGSFSKVVSKVKSVFTPKPTPTVSYSAPIGPTRPSPSGSTSLPSSSTISTGGGGSVSSGSVTLGSGGLVSSAPPSLPRGGGGGGSTLQSGEATTLQVISRTPGLIEVPAGTSGAITTTLAQATESARVSSGNIPGGIVLKQFEPPTIKELTKRELDLPPGAAGIFPISDAIVVGEKKLTREQEAELVRQAGGTGYLVNGQISTTPSGRGTTIQREAIPDARLRDLKNTIDFNVNAKLDNIYKGHIDEVTKEEIKKPLEDINKKQSELQDKVNSGDLSVEEANKKLKSFTDAVNDNYVKKVESKVLNKINNDPKIKNIQDKTISEYKRLGLTDLDKSIVEKKREQFTYNTRIAAEVGAVIAGYYFGGAVGGAVVTSAIAGLKVGAGKVIKERSALKIAKINYDSQGNIQSFQDTGQKIYKPEDVAKARGLYIESAIDIATLALPGVKSTSGGLKLTKPIILEAAQEISEKGARELLEQQLKAGTRTLTTKEISEGLVEVQVKNALGGIDNIKIPIKNIKAIVTAEERAITRARDLALGKDRNLKFISAGSIDEQKIVRAAIETNELGSYKIGDKTINQLTQQGSIQKFRAYDIKKAVDVDYYGTRLLTSVDGKGKQVDIVFKLTKNGKIVEGSSRVAITDLQTGLPDLYRPSTTKELKKLTTEITLETLDPSTAKFKIEAIDRLKPIDNRLILQKSNIEERIGAEKIIRVIDKKASIIKVGEPVRGAEPVSFLQALKQEPKVTKAVKYEELARSSSKEFQILTKEGVRVDVDTATKSLKATQKQAGLTFEFGESIDLTKPGLVFDDLANLPKVKPKIKPTKVLDLADINKVEVVKLTKKIEGGRIKKTIITDIGDTLTEDLSNLPRYVGGEAIEPTGSFAFDKFKQVISFVDLEKAAIPSFDETFIPAFTPDILGLQRIIPRAPSVKLAIRPQQKIFAPARGLIFGSEDLFKGRGGLDTDFGGFEIDLLKTAPGKIITGDLITKDLVRGGSKGAIQTKSLFKTVLAQPQITKLAPVSLVLPKIKPPRIPPRKIVTPIIDFPLPIIPPFAKTLDVGITPKSLRDFREAPKKGKFTASLASVLFNIRTRVKKSKVKSLSKKLDDTIFSGAELRPLIEVIDDKASKKKKQKPKGVDFASIFNL